MVAQAEMTRAKECNGISVDDMVGLVEDVGQDAAKGHANQSAAERISANKREQELTEERFLAQFAALEDGLALLEAQMRNMSEIVGQFGHLARRIRRSNCPAYSYPSDGQVGARPGLGQLVA